MCPGASPCFAAAAAALATWIAAESAVAGSGGAAAPAAPPAGPPCPHAEGAALSEIACELAAILPRAGAAPLVAAAPPRSDAPLARGPELSARIASLLAGRAPGSAVDTAATIDGALDRAGKRRLVFVVPELTRGTLRVTASVYGGARTFWERLLVPPRALAMAVSARRLDGEVQAFAGAVARAAPAVRKSPHAVPDVVAVACGDLDGDGATDAVIVGRRKVVLGRLDSDRFVPSREAAWADLSVIAPSPLREPIAGAVVRPAAAVDVGSTDRARGVRLSPALAPLAELAAPVPWSAVGCLAPAGTALGAPVPCRPGETPRVAPGDVRADAVAGGIVVGQDGAAHAVIAYRAPEGTVTLADDRGRSASLPRSGAQLAVGDLDRDGAPELAGGADTLMPAEDAVAVRTWTAGGQVVERFGVAVPEGVRALAACPPDGPGPSPLLVATPRELWVVR